VHNNRVGNKAYPFFFIIKEDNEMKDNAGTVTYKGKEYKLVFNLNVMENIQEEFGTIEKWTELTSGIKEEANAKAIKFGFTEMINEGLSIEAEENNTEFKPITKNFVGRMLTEIGLENMTKKLQETVIESTQTDEKNA